MDGIHQKKLKTKIIEALKAAKKGGSEITRGLSVIPISKPNVDEWFKRSLELSGLLRNFRTERQHIKIFSSGNCSQDSILQALSWQYIDDERFREFIDERIRTSHNSNLERFIARLAQSGANHDIYRWRRELLSTIGYGISSDIIKYFSGSSYGFDETIHVITSSFSSTTTTSNCKCRIERKFYTIPIDVDLFYTYDDYDKLQEAIDNRLNGKVLCKRCGRKKAQTHVFGDIVFIFVGNTIEAPDLIPVKGFDNIPPTINLKREQYDLTCFIEITSGNHAMANCYRKDKKWYHYNDLMPTVIQLTETDYTVYPICLMYKKHN